MRLLFFLVLQAFLSLPVVSQQASAVADYASILHSHDSMKIVDSLYCAKEDTLWQIGREYVSSLQKKHTYYQKLISGGCLTEKAAKRLRDDVSNDLNTIHELENYIIDTLPLYKEHLINEVVGLINSEIVDYADINRLSFVADTKRLVYYDADINQTNDVVRFIEERGRLSSALFWVLIRIYELESKVESYRDKIQYFNTYVGQK